jgi:hypothetical protein
MATPGTPFVVPTPLEMAEWGRVNICEEGGDWHVNGSVYGGGLGISLTNWSEYGGLAAFGPEWEATPEQQVEVAMKIQGGREVPDQDGCGGGW